MTGLPRMVPIAALILLAGCHLTSQDGLPADLGVGRGRVDRQYVAGLGQAVRATLTVLDELEVRPVNGIIRSNDGASVLGKAKWAGQTNSEYLPDDASFHDLFDRQRLTVANAEPVPFPPLLLAYKGELKGGRSVVVIVRSQPPDAKQTLIMARVGRDGDEAWGKQFLDMVATRLPQPAQPPAAAALPPLPGQS